MSAEKLDALEKRVIALEALLAPKPAPKPEPFVIPGPPRDGKGNVIITAEASTKEEARRREQIENEKAAEAAQKAERAANGGCWKGPDGLWRTADGRLASMVAAESAAHADAMRKLREERE